MRVGQSLGERAEGEARAGAHLLLPVSQGQLAVQRALRHTPPPADLGNSAPLRRVKRGSNCRTEGPFQQLEDSMSPDGHKYSTWHALGLVRVKTPRVPRAIYHPGWVHWG